MRSLIVAGALWPASSGSGPSNTLAANPCATPGASYLETFAEQPGGTCGTAPSQVLNVNTNGTVTSSVPVSCASTEQSGCTAHDADCAETTNGVTCMVTTDVTFASDGSSATGLETLSCSNASSSCVSTYTVSAARQ